MIVSVRRNPQSIIRLSAVDVASVERLVGRLAPGRWGSYDLTQRDCEALRAAGYEVTRGTPPSVGGKLVRLVPVRPGRPDDGGKGAA